MLYYIIKEKNNNHTFKAIENTTDATYHDLEREGFNVVGVFGRTEYAQIHCDFRNGKINRKELNNKLNSTP